jgi:hypothetical protein
MNGVTQSHHHYLKGKHQPIYNMNWYSTAAASNKDAGVAAGASGENVVQP